MAAGGRCKEGLFEDRHQGRHFCVTDDTDTHRLGACGMWSQMTDSLPSPLFCCHHLSLDTTTDSKSHRLIKKATNK